MKTSKIIELLKAASESDAKNVAEYVRLSKELGLLYKGSDGRLFVSGNACFELLDTIYSDNDVDNIEVYAAAYGTSLDGFHKLKDLWSTSKKLSKALFEGVDMPLNKEEIHEGVLAGINASNYPYDILLDELEEQFSN